MQYLNDLKTVITINSFTQNKAGVDAVGERFDTWFETLGFEKNIYERELIGNHRYYTSKHTNNSKKLLLLGHIDTVFPKGKFEDYSEDVVFSYDDVPNFSEPVFIEVNKKEE